MSMILERPKVSGQAFSAIAKDRFRVSGRRYEPGGSAIATVVIHGATAAPQAFYARFARYLAWHGLRVLTYDYRGVGDSRPTSLRRFDATMMDWVEDARAVIRHAADTWDVPVLAVGHSFGGQLLGLCDEMRESAAAVLVGAQLGYYRDFPVRRQPELAFFWHVVVPSLTHTLGYLPGQAGLGTDLPAGVALEWRRWCTSPSYFADDHPDAVARLAAFDRPTLMLSFSDDTFAPERTVEALKARLTGARLWHRHVRPRELGVRSLGHFGFFRPRQGAELWVEALHFLLGAAEGKLPSPTPEGEEWMKAITRDLEYGRA
jgi:predicted alpha/beta hydrolase